VYNQHQYNQQQRSSSLIGQGLGIGSGLNKKLAYDESLTSSSSDTNHALPLPKRRTQQRQPHCLYQPVHLSKSLWPLLMISSESSLTGYYLLKPQIFRLYTLLPHRISHQRKKSLCYGAIHSLPNTNRTTNHLKSIDVNRHLKPLFKPKIDKAMDSFGPFNMFSRILRFRAHPRPDFQHIMCFRGIRSDATVWCWISVLARLRLEREHKRLFPYWQ
jgi:hypothetical protein